MPRITDDNNRRLRAGRLATERLRELNIPYSDVVKNSLVCCGQVRVAVKYSRLKWEKKYPLYEFYTTPAERQRGSLDAHLVLLIADRGSAVDFYILDASDPVFYKEDGKLKTIINYVVDAKPYDGTNSLNRWKMAEAKDQWGKIGEILSQLLMEHLRSA